ncbi:unnamed protein product, partial [Staurois parvus]
KKAYEKGTRGISWGPLLTPGPWAVPEFPNGQSVPLGYHNVRLGQHSIRLVQHSIILGQHSVRLGSIVACQNARCSPAITR